MLDQQDTRAVRREAMIERILDEAWTLARRDGLTAFNLRDLAEAVGMRAPSLYSYFDSKFALYDAMFAQANRELLASAPRFDGTADFETQFRRSARFWATWGVADPVRHQLLFQRTIPGFEPSAESYAIAIEVVDQAREAFAAAGLPDAATFDLWTSIVSGLVSQQLANEPGGKRYLRLLDDAIDMFLDHVGNSRKRKGKKR